jgi:hypothetical protein
MEIAVLLFSIEPLSQIVMLLMADSRLSRAPIVLAGSRNSQIHDSKPDDERLIVADHDRREKTATFEWYRTGDSAIVFLSLRDLVN